MRVTLHSLMMAILSTGLLFIMPAIAVDEVVDHRSNDADVYGEWVPPDGDAIVKVAPCEKSAQLLCAYLVRHAYEDLSEYDSLNPNRKLRERPLIGVEILNNVKKTKKDGQWRGGDLYDPRTGKSYYAKVGLLNHDKLKITGCIGPGLCKGYVWTRVDNTLVDLMPGSVVNESINSRDDNAMPVKTSQGI